MANNELTLFDFNGADIRVIDMDGEAWFPAKDVCDVLGIKVARYAVKANCDTEDFRTVSASEVSTSNGGSTNISFPNRGMLCVNETGIYDLIGASRKPEARKFRKWVNGTVLPRIRRDGGYVLGEEKIETTEDLLRMNNRLHEFNANKIKQLEGELAEKTQDLNTVSERTVTGSLRLTQLAAQFPGVNLNQIANDLCREKVLHRRGGQLHAYSKYRDTHFGERMDMTNVGPKSTIIVLPEGLKLIAKLIRQRKITMKKGY